MNKTVKRWGSRKEVIVGVSKLRRNRLAVVVVSVPPNRATEIVVGRQRGVVIACVKDRDSKSGLDNSTAIK